jgi:cobalt transporter subunit CbtB
MTTTTVSSASVSVSQRLIIGFTCFFLGSFLVFGTGLAQDGRLHNAAHDTRHAIGFPCH